MPPPTPTYPPVEALTSIIVSMDQELEVLRNSAEKATMRRELLAHQLNYYFTALTCPRVQCISTEPVLQIMDNNKLRMRDTVCNSNRDVPLLAHPQSNKRNYYDEQIDHMKGALASGSTDYNFSIANPSYIINSRYALGLRQREVAAYIKKRKVETIKKIDQYTEQFMIHYNKWQQDDEASQLQRHLSINAKREIKVDIYGRKKEKFKSNPNKLVTKMSAPIKQKVITGDTIDYDSKATLITDPFDYERVHNKSVLWLDEEIRSFLIYYMTYPKNFKKISELMPNKTYIELVNFYYTLKYPLKLKKYYQRYFTKGKRNSTSRWEKKVSSILLKIRDGIKNTDGMYSLQTLLELFVKKKRTTQLEAPPISGPKELPINYEYFKRVFKMPSITNMYI